MTTQPPTSAYLAASAAFADAARRVSLALAKHAMERVMTRLAHIAVTGRLR